MSCKLAIVVPVLNESEQIKKRLSDFKKLAAAGYELVFVDGGSEDGSRALLAAHFDHVYLTDKGRARQMNFGAQRARADYVLFLHIDTKLPEDFARIFSTQVAQASWGFFLVRLESSKIVFRVVERGINLRSLITGSATGDQAIFVRRRLFDSMGSFADVALMEDVEFSRRMKKRARPCIVKSPVCTSARRWQKNGVLYTVILMWSLQLLYRLGVSTEKLQRLYYGKVS